MPTANKSIPAPDNAFDAVSNLITRLLRAISKAPDRIRTRARSESQSRNRVDRDQLEVSKAKPEATNSAESTPNGIWWSAAKTANTTNANVSSP